MKLVTYLAPGSDARAGVLVDEDRILDLSAISQASGGSLPGSVLELIDMGQTGLSALQRAVEDAERNHLPSLAIDGVRLLSPLPRPRKLLAVAGNYTAHVEESGGRVIEKEQSTVRPFIKPSNSVIGHEDIIQFPGWSDTLDYEAELAIVIGKLASNVSAEQAADCIFGYTAFNDVSARKLTIAENRTPRDGDSFFDWLMGKWFDTFASMGPAIVTSGAVEDPHALSIQLRVNGETRQQENSGNMIYNCFELVSFFSHITTLEPGDVIATGTPSGVGLATGKYLSPGDVVEVEIEQIGVLRNLVQ